MQNAVAECLLSPWVRHQEGVPSAEEIGGGIQGGAGGSPGREGGCEGWGKAGRPGWMPRGSGSSFPLPKLLVLISNTDDFWGSHWAEPMLGLLGLFFGLRQSGSQLAWFFRSVC